MSGHNKQYQDERYNAIKSDPEKYRAYLDRKNAEQAKRRAEGRGPKNAAQQKARWRARNPETAQAIRQAGHAVERALKSGKIEKPDHCQHCYKRGPVEAHHHMGYEKRWWLAVIWLCQTCHSAEHHGPRTLMDGQNTSK